MVKRLPLFFDSGRTGNTTKWGVHTISDITATMESTDEGLILTTAASAVITSRKNYPTFWVKKDDTSNDGFDWTGDFTVEFDIIEFTGNWYFRIWDNNTEYSMSLSDIMGNDNNGHWTVIKTGYTIYTYYNEVNLQNVLNTDNALQIGLQNLPSLHNPSQLILQNFRIDSN